MAELGAIEVSEELAGRLPSWPEIVAQLRENGAGRTVDVLRDADRCGRPLVQPRCGVGAHQEMLTLLRELEASGPAILSVTIDSYTRLGQFDVAARVLAEDPHRLNGYPLVAHGWQRGRQLVEAVGVPLEIRHGSPDGRQLFATALAAGFTSYEGGGIGYNLPYCKDVPLADSLRAWQQIDTTCGMLATEGVLVDRELFGTLTAVLVPPSVSIAVTMLEAMAAAQAGVRCLSIAYPQGGEIHQDVAALRAIRALARRYLVPQIEVFPVLHQFMGAFPDDPALASALILYGGLLARLGGATKVISKTEQEAHGLPDGATNGRGIRTTAVGASGMFDFVKLDEDRIAEEQSWIEREVGEQVEPLLAGGHLTTEIRTGFRTGRLDIPFSASRHAHSRIIPRRDRSGAIRYADSGNLPFSAASRRRNAALLADADDSPAPGRRETGEIAAMVRDIAHFSGRSAACP
ncbi:methylaspartate mutase [Sciscionella sediminilitoris]|uniref:methylaspartate mutase n=1 Tax=Sciscionella sediminilitoris TaxID=1445613 RepID=UPI0004DF4EA9|nr:methylaspartate mutase [Sciscionella sp. SE31]